MSVAQRRRDASRYRKSATLFTSLLMSTGLILALVGGIGAWRGWLTTSWPVTEATLVLNRLETGETTRTVPMTDRLRGGIRETVETETLALTYRYAVDGVVFEGHKLEPWEFGLPSRSKMQTTAAMGEGAKHRVAYDASDPRRAYLLPGPSTTSLTLTTVGLVLMALGFLLGRLLRRA